MQRHKMKAARQAAGLTALALSELTGIRECRLYALERGRGRLHADEAKSIASALQVPPWTIAPQWFFAPPEGGAR